MPVIVHVNMAPLSRFAAEIARGVNDGSGPFGAAMKQWAAVYRAYIMDRFDRFSKGGGNWAPLAESTRRSRREARSGHTGERVFTILRDTNILYNATDVRKNGDGWLSLPITGGIRVGFGGPSRHPGGAATIADIAGFHQEGGPHLPARPIIVDPDEKTIALMEAILEEAIARALE